MEIGYCLLLGDRSGDSELAEGNLYEPALSPTGSRLACFEVVGWSSNRVVNVWDTASRALTATLRLRDLAGTSGQSLRTLTWVGDESLAIGTDKSCHLWTIGQDPVRLFEISRDGHLLGISE